MHPLCQSYHDSQAKRGCVQQDAEVARSARKRELALTRLNRAKAWIAVWVGNAVAGAQ